MVFDIFVLFYMENATFCKKYLANNENLLNFAPDTKAFVKCKAERLIIIYNIQK